ncbi:MAG: DUF4292 domain-containing protein [Chitinophagales bacterium]
MQKIFFILISLVLLTSACKTTKVNSSKLPKTNSKKLNSIVQKNNFDFEYFSNKARVNFNKQSFTANFRMKKDSVIWISLTGPFNIEGARIIITKNKFKMIDKLGRKYYNKPISYLENFIPIKADFKLIEDLILGNFVEERIKKQKIETKGDTYIVKGSIPMLEAFYFIERSGKFQSIEILEKAAERKVVVDFSKYEKIDNQLFALKRNFKIKDKEKDYLLDLKFYKHNKQKTDFPFSIPNGYTKIE